MANEDTLASSLPELTAGNSTDVSPELVPAPPSPPPSNADPPAQDPIPTPTPVALPPPPLRPSLVPLGSQAPAPPQPKRFSAVNINKKFLEKNSSSSAASVPTSSNSPASKTGGPVSRPQTQATTSHSRLVTTKLTAAPQSLSAPGTGWSRPPSATPPAPGASGATNPNGPTAPAASDAPSSSSSGPQPKPVAQPQPRPVPSRGLGSLRDGAGKPVWGSARSQQQQRPDMSSQSDFPTAAEVAAAPRKVKPTQADRNLASKEAAALELASAAANKQARMEEADTFRGVHLDPNAHHWDEAEDDDDFLDGVIEFGDGRKYEIEAADLPTDPSGTTLAATESATSIASPSPPRDASRSRSRLDEVPVSKEERFADDFDRSWPRSRASPSVSTRDLPSALSTHSSSSAAAAAPSPVSPVISHAHAQLHSPQDGSRALLFNERSNKLEPYKGGNQKRGDGFPSPTDTRGREFAGQQGGNNNNVQLLQNRGRGFSGGPGGGGFNNERQQGRAMPPPQQGNANAPQQSPRVPANPWMQRMESDGGTERGRRLGTMGPPPVPAPQAQGAGFASAAGGRQRPPHLPLVASESDGLPVRPQRRPSTSRESRGLPPPTTPGTAGTEPPLSARRPSQSPALSHASAVAHSPVLSAAQAQPPQLSGPDLDEVRKDLMQSAAARAKARRQQEEEEREKEKERARRKAAEIEEKIKALEAEKAKAKEVKEAEEASRAQVIILSSFPLSCLLTLVQDVLDIIETAVKSVEVKPEAAIATLPTPQAVVSPPLAPVRRPSFPVQPPLDSRPPPPRRISSSSASNPPPIQTAGASSWRSKASPISATLPTPTPVRQVQSRPAIPPFMATPTALEQVESLAENPDEELEVVDFSDLGKFIGVTEEEEEEEMPAPEPEPTPAPAPIATPARAPRPVASDFFDDRPETAFATPEKTTWRRQGVPDSEHPQLGESRDRPRSDVHPEASFTSEALLTGPPKDVDHHSPSAAVPVPSPHVNRTPRNQQPFYKEATMSTLDDVMSRIKGALDGMQTSEREHRSPEVSAAIAVPRSSLFHPSPAANLSVQKERWVVPAFRTRQFDAEPQEVIVTGCEPPRSPKPAWNTFSVRLPKISQPMEPVNRKQILSFTRANLVRWDILSFDPPVEGMSRREFTVNEILFRRTGGFKGKSKFKVLLPSTKTTGPRVNIPMSPRVNGIGAFGRPSADGLSTWRKPASSVNLDQFESETGLSTMSRSPPPELPSDPSVASIPRPDASKSEDVFGSLRSRSQPKMPAGSAVAFYREPDTKPLVNFIVNSELEDSRHGSENNTLNKSKPSIMVSSPATNSLAPGEPLNSASKPFTPRLKSSPTSSPEIPSLMSNSKAESKSSDDSTDRTPITPPSHHTASWARSSLNISVKDSPIRGPDPEHLKAVWLQTSNKAGLHAVNSLEGIADDLTAIPFTLQEVKSEDGGTPPPTIAPSRMSLHDVTRAFQQVPSSSSNSSLRPPISPPSTSAPVARPPTYTYPLPPPPNQMMRPNYGPYSPMPMSSPNMMYPMAPSPVPSRMGVNGMPVNGMPVNGMPVNGHAPLYSQPVWMAPQNHTGMMRPMGSPYPPQLMGYPSPGGSPMYAPQPQPMQNAPQPPNGPRRSMSSVMSPVMQPHQQNVMYPGSPILMHAPPMPTGYMNMNVPAGRGQMRNDNGHSPMLAQQQQQQHQQQQQQHPQHQPNGHPMHTTGYNPVPSTSFVRPTW
ncbi:hypothetical protein B0H16DRAFT_1708191 [Mycena metata]|uniref:Uncharacterized protein n=1 Tax=Mycena metata TaxID=1033252 RepID=A0AAD7KKU3_9AGAR|nr:hypothetical protein B0H16DRAFT_1708191 [Mycena metata]